ncbi:MAG TPA: CPBP family intramembrane glutamic endopeptidase [Thermoanaerobaculia bacterium]|nr:CPBP family intramembrane glutamic endopeptidase [Thermoanaerobaculia bacterium]
MGGLSDLLALVGAVAVALALDVGTARRGFTPPGFASPLRRALALTLVAGFFYLTLFLPLAAAPLAEPSAPAAPEEPSLLALFSVQGMIVGVVVGWFLLAFAGGRDLRATFARQLGLVSRRPGEDVLLGLGAVGVGWILTLVTAFAVATFVVLLGKEDLLPKEMPEPILWIAGQSVLLRFGLSLAAGVFEEIFFRGLLQPRMGIALSTGLFVLAHAGYQNPFMLVGLTALSLFLAALVRWRQSLWPAIVAHFGFDLWQLVVVIPTALRFMPQAPGVQ